MMIKKVTSLGYLIIFLTFFFAASLIIISCNTSTSESVLERNKRFVLNMNDVLWNKGKLDRMNEFFSPKTFCDFLSYKIHWNL